jgi:nucleoside-diphosphate-sugar epimerase
MSGGQSWYGVDGLGSTLIRRFHRRYGVASLTNRGGFMRALVTGAAGFIGSHLVEGLAAGGWEVVGVDSLTPYYDVSQKRANLAQVHSSAGVGVKELDLLTCDIDALLEGIDVVFHQAGQPGVRASWNDFGSYAEHNLMVTQRLLAAAPPSLTRFVFASSSSVYGNATSYPTHEHMLPKPQSPYGVTKLAAEHLCGVYARTMDVHTVSLRYFTVFGPRQRPDMAMHRLINAALTGTSFPLFGSGKQVRDFTYVGDVVQANILASKADVAPGTVMNIAGGGATTLLEVISTIEDLSGKQIDLERLGNQAGDVDRTGGATAVANAALGWQPTMPLADGLARQIMWHETSRRNVS